MKKWIVLNIAITLLACGAGFLAMRFFKAEPSQTASDTITEPSEALPPPPTEIILTAEEQALYEGRKDYYDSIAHLLKALKERDEVAIREHINLPFTLDYPLPPLTTPKEFIDHFYSVLTEEQLARLFSAHPVQLWEGPLKGDFMCNVAFIWLTYEEPTQVITLPTPTAELVEAQSNEVKFLHPSLQEGDPTPILSFITEDGRLYGRVDKLDIEEENGVKNTHPYRISLYYKDTAPTAAPDAVMYCRYWVEGSANNEYYQSKNGYFRLDVNHAGPIDMSDIDIFYPFVEDDESRTMQYRATYYTWPTS